jgi:hypothetical protein
VALYLRHMAHEAEERQRRGWAERSAGCSGERPSHVNARLARWKSSHPSSIGTSAAISGASIHSTGSSDP